MKFAILLTLIGVINLIFILFLPLNIQGKNPTYVISLKKHVNIDFHSDIFIPISFKLIIV